MTANLCAALKKPALIVSRASLIASWEAAQRMADAQQILSLTHASAAGWLLHDAHGDVRKALASVPTGFSWWDGVRAYLHAIRDDDEM